MAAAEEAAAAVGALLAAWARAMSREHHQPTEPPHPCCGAHWDPAARAASATQPPPGTHSLARRPGAEGGRGQRRERERRKTRRDGGPGSGEEEGSPALRESVSRINPGIKLFQFKHLLKSSLPHVGSGSQESGSQRHGRGKPSGWRASAVAQPRPLPPVAAEAAKASEPPGSRQNRD